jgi:hypothetical protein
MSPAAEQQITLLERLVARSQMKMHYYDSRGVLRECAYRRRNGA